MKRVLAILLLACLLLIGVGAATSATFTVEVFDATNGNSPIKDAHVVISSGSNTYSGYTLQSGIAEFSSIEYPEDYTIKVSKSGYKSVTQSHYFSEDDKRAPIYLISETPVMITVTSVDNHPVSGAEVIINQKSVGKTDGNGRIHVSMGRDENNAIEVVAESYIPQKKNYFIEKNQTTLSIQLTDSQVTPLIIVYNDDKSPVQGAAISISNNLVAYTDSYGQAQLSTYKAGKYPVDVNANGYLPFSGTIEFTDTNTSATITLNTTSSTLTIMTLAGNAPVPNTVIYFDGQIKGMTDASGIYTTDVAPNTKLYISASHEGYTADSRTYVMNPDSSNKIIIQMKQNISYTLIGIGALAVIVAIIIAILVIGGMSKKRRGKKVSSPEKSYPPTTKRDSL